MTSDPIAAVIGGIVLSLLGIGSIVFRRPWSAAARKQNLRLGFPRNAASQTPLLFAVIGILFVFVGAAMIFIGLSSHAR